MKPLASRLFALQQHLQLHHCSARYLLTDGAASGGEPHVFIKTDSPDIALQHVEDHLSMGESGQNGLHQPAS